MTVIKSSLFSFTGFSLLILGNAKTCLDSICTYDEPDSCSDLIANNFFRGTCCSLSENSDGGCKVSVSAGTCYWEPNVPCNDCGPYGSDGKILHSRDTETCPTSDYNPLGLSTTTKNAKDSFQIRELLSFKISLKGTPDQFIQINYDLKATLEAYLAIKLSESFDTLQKIVLKNLGFLGNGQIVAENTEEFSFSGSAYFIDDAYIPTVEKVQEQQVHSMFDYRAELEDILQENGIYLRLYGIAFDDGENKHNDKVNSVDPVPIIEDNNMDVPLYLWSSIVIAFIIFIIFKYGRQYQNDPKEDLIHVLRQQREFVMFEVDDPHADDALDNFSAEAMARRDILSDKIIC